MEGDYLELMEHWRFLQKHRRDVAIIKGIQERLVALVDAARDRNVVENPEQVVPLQADDNALSALDEEIAAMQQETSAVLANKHTSGVSSVGDGLQPGLTGLSSVNDSSSIVE